MVNNYKQEVENVEKILLMVDRGEIQAWEAIYKLMKLTLKYKKLRLPKMRIYCKKHAREIFGHNSKLVVIGGDNLLK